MKELPNKQSENEEEIIIESPEENIQYEVDEPMILLDPRGNIFIYNNKINFKN